ncbi:MAG: hypothetical protein RBQ94_07240, partial [Methanimicrococcus sp.]|nr:hypothetical protein [Methanimicrococcus sp.]
GPAVKEAAKQHQPQAGLSLTAKGPESGKRHTRGRDYFRRAEGGRCFGRGAGARSEATKGRHRMGWLYPGKNYFWVILGIIFFWA